MKNFLIGKADPIIQFGPLHIFISLIVIIGIILIVKNKNRISNLNNKAKTYIRYFIVITMFLNMSVYYLSYIYYGIYDWKVHLPFHFCFISGYLFMFSVLFNKERLYKIAYYFAFFGPLPAMIWPDLNGGLNNFIFYQFFISHHFFFLANLFMYYSYNYKFKNKDSLNAFLTANCIFIFMMIFNNICGTNYIMSKSLPEYFLNMYPIFKSINYPFIILEITAIIIIFIANIPIKKEEKIYSSRLLIENN